MSSYYDTAKGLEGYKQVEYYKEYSVGDTIRIERWYYPEDGPDFQKTGNWRCVDGSFIIIAICVYVYKGFERTIFWCNDGVSTSVDDIANKGIVIRGSGSSKNPNLNRDTIVLDRKEYLDKMDQMDKTVDKLEKKFDSMSAKLRFADTLIELAQDYMSNYYPSPRNRSILKSAYESWEKLKNL